MSIKIKIISIKNHLLTKYIRLKDLNMKNETQNRYKQYEIVCLICWQKVKYVTLQSTSKTTLMI